MCLAIVALDAHPAFALVIAANRDEFHARPAAPAAWGAAPPFHRILAGRDLQAGGTWLGIRRDGRWAISHRHYVHEMDDTRLVENARYATDGRRNRTDPSYGSLGTVERGGSV